jgi:hypothetical protein
MLALTVFLGMAAGGADNSSAQSPAPATFTLPPANSGSPFGSTALNLPSKGYVEQEFLVSGVANRYRIKDPLKTAELVDGGQAYTTRILVRRPTNPARFNGVVVVEWYNVTLGQDIDFVFSGTRNHLLDKGYAWVGVSAQLIGANALKTANPARYGSINLVASNVDPNGGTLDARSDVLSWDVYTQIATALRKPAGPGAARPLGNLRPKLVIAAGESQSAARLSSYYNSIQPLYPDVFDGYLTYDRVFTPQRTDMKAKHLSFGSEVFPAPPPPDTNNLRLWEVAGASHVGLNEISSYIDEQVVRSGLFRPEGAPTSLTKAFHGCETQPVFSRVPNGEVLSAGLAALVAWIKDGKAPPTAPRMIRDSEGRVIRDAEGRVSGGIRLAAYDAPMAKNMGTNTGPGFCGLSGSHLDFTPAELCRRYGAPRNYVAKVTEITHKAVRDGFLLKADGDIIIQQARSVSFICR